MVWTQVTHPLTLVGLALFLVFGLIRAKRGRQSSWLAPAGMLMALVAFVCGLYLAFKESELDKLPPAPTASTPQSPSLVQSPPQTTSSAEASGMGSVAVSDSKVEGGIKVDIHMDMQDKK